MNANPLLELVRGIAERKIRVIDLTQTLSPDFPQIELPPEMGQCWPFRLEEVSRYDDRGAAAYWNNFSCGEHTGTHFDAPIHWVSGRNLPNNSTDTVPIENMVAPACVVDCAKHVEQNADFLLSANFLRNWEEEHGRIPPRSWVLMRTDWSKRPDRNPTRISTRKGSTRRGRTPTPCASWSRSATSWASAASASAPTPARPSICARPTPAITMSTAPAATACNA